jgi:hypothetical protein
MYVSKRLLVSFFVALLAVVGLVVAVARPPVTGRAIRGEALAAADVPRSDRARSPERRGDAVHRGNRVAQLIG